MGTGKVPRKSLILYPQNKMAEYNPKFIDKVYAKLLPKSYFLAHHKKTNREFVYLLSFDVEYPEDVKVLPQTIATLKKYGISSSFAVIGQYVTDFPNEHKLLKDAKHEVVNHSYTHPFHDRLNPDVNITDLNKEQLLGEIVKTNKAIEKTIGVKVFGWRTPHFGCQFPKIYKIIKELGFTYSSSKCDSRTTDGLPYQQDGIVELPITSTTKFPFAIFDTWNYRTGNKPLLNDSGEFLDLWRQELLFARKNNLFINHYFDPYYLSKNDLLEKMCQFCSDQKIKTMTYSEYIKHFL